MIQFIIFIIFMCVFLTVILPAINKQSMRNPNGNPSIYKEEPPSPIVEGSHLFHETVGQYAQNHEDRIGRNLVKHPEPEIGYVVLNGQKKKLEDCKWL